MLAREIHLMEEGIFLCNKHYCVTIWLYLLGVLEDKPHKPTAEISFSQEVSPVPNTGVSEPALTWPHFPTEHLLFCPISLHYSHLHTYPSKEKAIKGRI